MNPLLRKQFRNAIKLLTDSSFEDFVAFLFSTAHGDAFTTVKQKHDKSMTRAAMASQMGMPFSLHTDLKDRVQSHFAWFLRILISKTQEKFSKTSENIRFLLFFAAVRHSRIEWIQH
jgi:hypothetical protein